MKKQILLSAMLGFAAFNMCAADLTVTSPSGDAAVEGSFPNIMASLNDGDVIKFNMESDEIEAFPAITLDTKSLTIDGLNQKTGNKIKFTGANQTLSMKGVCTIAIKNCVFTGKKDAQALFVQTGATLNIQDCEFLNNAHKSSGGVIGISQDVKCSIKNCLFDGNSANGGDGGCLRIYNNAQVSVDNSTFINNHSSGSGGVVYMYSTKDKAETNFSLTMTNCTLTNNYSGNRAGAIYVYSRDTTTPLTGVKLVNCTISGNYSTLNLGGGIFLCSNTGCKTGLTMINTIVSGNTGGLGFVENVYYVPTDLGFWKGDKDDTGNERERNYEWNLKNNIYSAVYSTPDDTQLHNVDQSALFDNSNIKVADFANGNIFSKLYKLDNTVFPDIEDDIVWSPVLTTEGMPVAALAENSIAIGKGIAAYEGVTVPATDQLGKARPAAPAIGAVEYDNSSAISSVEENASLTVFASDNAVRFEGADEAVVSVYTMGGQLVKEVKAVAGAPVALDGNNGVLVVKVKAAGETKTAKVVIR